MSKKKFAVREAFREAVFQRDLNRCRVCGEKERVLDAHHITDRHHITNGGYVKENGITLCPECHLLAEDWHSLGIGKRKYHPDELYKLIGSSKELAFQESEKL
jgi:5-methylcytosine-specific restriction endonuclease McrA